MTELSAQGFAIWHPEHGFAQPRHYEGTLATVASDDLTRDTLNLNRECRQTNRTGWRIVPVTISREPPQ